MAECRGLKRKQERQEFSFGQQRGSVLVKTFSSPLSHPSAAPDVSFQPFVFDGFVSLDDGVESRKPVRILCDTGGSQSFILSDILDSACNTSVIVQSIEMGFVTVALHCVWVTSDLASGCSEVAVHLSLRVKGIDFIMGNGSAGGKVMPVVQVTDVPHTDLQSDVGLLVKSFPDVFSVSAVMTCAQTKHDIQENVINSSTGMTPC